MKPTAIGMFFLLLIVSSEVSAQDRVAIEADLGITRTSRSLTGLPNGSAPEEDSGQGVAGGAAVWYRLAAPVELGLSGILVTKGYRYVIREGTTIIKYERFDPYVSFPLLGRMGFLNDHIFAIGGLSADVLLASGGPGRRRVVLGGLAGVGVRWGRFSIDARYHRDFSSAFEAADQGLEVREKFSTVYFVLGVRLFGGR